MLRHSIEISTIVFLAYSLVFITSILGNSFILVALYKTPGLRTTTNIFIGNLAICDLLTTIFCIPFNFAVNILYEWPFGSFFCKLVPYIQAVTVNASVNSLVFISLDRCLTINRPFSYNLRYKILLYSLTIIWVIPMIYMSPWIFVFTLKPYYLNHNYQICSDFWENKNLADAYFIIVNLILSYLLPLLCISICYIIMYMKIRSRIIPGELCPNQRRIIHYKSKMKVIKMITIVIITFTISWLPLYVLFIIEKFFNFPSSKLQEKTFFNLFAFAQWLASSNSCTNPFIYSCYSKKFRSEFKLILKKIFGVRKKNFTARVYYTVNPDCVLISSSHTTSFS